MGIPYTHSGIASSAIAMNKVLAKLMAKAIGIKVPKHTVLKAATAVELMGMGRLEMRKPYIIKPISQGSSFGVLIIGDDEDEKRFAADESVYSVYGDELMLEEYINGKELSVTVVRDKAIGALELISKGEVFDYDAKYVEGMVAQHIATPDIPDDIRNKMMLWSQKIHKELGCKSLSRSDFRYDPALGDDGLYFIECNTHPGLTATSMVPDMLKNSGSSLRELMEILIEDACCELKDKNQNSERCYVRDESSRLDSA